MAYPQLIDTLILVTVLDPILRIPCDVYVYLAGSVLHEHFAHLYSYYRETIQQLRT